VKAVAVRAAKIDAGRQDEVRVNGQWTGVGAAEGSLSGRIIFREIGHRPTPETEWNTSTDGRLRRQSSRFRYALTWA